MARDEKLSDSIRKAREPFVTKADIKEFQQTGAGTGGSKQFLGNKRREVEFRAFLRITKRKRREQSQKMRIKERE